MGRVADLKPTTLRLFKHCLYEYDKGVRQLLMLTLTASDTVALVERLHRASIDYYRHDVAPDKINLFFGRQVAVETVQWIVNKPLNTLSPEEDFILGTLLGYDKEQQCLRYLAKKRPSL